MGRDVRRRPLPSTGHLVRKPVAVTQNQVGSESVTSEGANTSHQPQFLPQTRYAEGEVLNSFAHHTQSSLQSHTIEKVPPPYGVRAPFAPHTPIVHTACRTSASTAVCRYSRFTAATGITVSNTATKQMLLACRRPAKRMLPRFGPMLPKRHRCDCRAIRPTAGVAALSESNTWRRARCEDATER